METRQGFTPAFQRAVTKSPVPAASAGVGWH